MRHDRSPHPVGYALAWREPMNPWQRQLRETIIASVRAVFSDSSSWQEAASRIGTRYETIYHWRQACPELGGLKTAERQLAGSNGYDTAAIPKGRKNGKSQKSLTRRS